jgi:Spy/CpxP family protein refolding chaperone
MSDKGESGMNESESKNRWRLWSGVIAIFIVGMIVGGLSATVLMRSHIVHIMRKGPPPRVHEHIVNRLTEDLTLTADQRTAVERIVREFEPRFRAFEEQSRAEVKKIAGQMEDEIRGILTPEQQAKYDANLQRMRADMERRGGARHRKR